MWLVERACVRVSLVEGSVSAVLTCRCGLRGLPTTELDTIVDSVRCISFCRSPSCT